MAKDDKPLGATGDYPLGKLNDSDEGEHRMAVYTDCNRLIIDFGKPVAWIGLDKRTALQLAELINHHAEMLKDVQ